LEILNQNQIFLAYRFQVLMTIVKALEASTVLLPLVLLRKDKSYSYAIHHYAYWTAFSKTVFKSIEYVNPWLTVNNILFKYLSEHLRMYTIRMWLSIFDSIRKATNSQLAGLACHWHHIVIQQYMACKGRSDNYDWRDEFSIFNIIILFGAQEWT